MRRILGFLLVCVCSTLCYPGDILVSSSFSSSTELWTSRGTFVSSVEKDAMARRILAKDTGSASWYFVAPPSFLGDMRVAFGGMLSFRLGHLQADDGGMGVTSDWDIILESKKAFAKERSTALTQLGIKGVYIPWSNTVYQVPLAANSGWINMATGNNATNWELIRVLKELSGLSIRGGFFKGNTEVTWLTDIKIIQGTNPGSDWMPSVAPSAIPMYRSQMCSTGVEASVTMRPVGAFDDFNVVLTKPWSRGFTISRFPIVCSDVMVEISAMGDLQYINQYIEVRTSDGNNLIAKAFQDSRSYANNMEISDGFIIPRHLVSAFSFNRELTLQLSVLLPDNDATNVQITSFRVSFYTGGCYLNQAIPYPGLSPVIPNTNSGKIASLTFNPITSADDYVTISLNATSLLEYAGHQVALVPVGSSYSSSAALQLFGGPSPYGSSSTQGSMTTRTASVVLSRDQFAALNMSGQYTADMVTNLQSPQTIQINRAALLYAPKYCFTQSITPSSKDISVITRDINATIPFVFNTGNSQPMGDGILTIVASIPAHNSDKWIRIKRAEGSFSVMGYAFEGDFSGHDTRPDPSVAFTDTIIIPKDTLKRDLSDGKLELTVEVDLPRMQSVIEWPADSGLYTTLPTFDNQGSFILRSLTLSFASQEST